MPPQGSLLRRRLGLLLCLGPLSALLVLAVNAWICQRARGRVFLEATAMPRQEVGIVLGCSPALADGRPNLFFQGRMEAAAELFHAGRVSHLLLSGDNSSRAYDEPTAMREALQRRGVPAEAMTLDYAGFRTLDTMVRARKIFGVHTATIVTDDFHTARSLFLAESAGIRAVAFPSRAVPLPASAKTRAREVASRFVAWLDVYLWRTGPRFLGPREPLALAQR